MFCGILEMSQSQVESSQGYLLSLLSVTGVGSQHQ